MRRLIPYLLSATALFGCRDNGMEEGEHSLKVVVETAAPSSFMVGGERFGYGYELLTEWAADEGRELQMEDNYSLTAAIQALNIKYADAVVTLARSVDDTEYELLRLFTTNYVILTTHRWEAKFRPLREGLTDEAVGDAAVMLAAGFDRTLSYSPLMDSLRSAHIYSSARDIYALAQEVVNGTYRLLICERSQAMLVLYMNRELTQVYEFAEQVAVNVMFRRGDRRGNRFVRWLGEYSRTPEFNAITSVYMERGLGRRFRGMNRSNRVVGGISVWDDILQQVGSREGVDWLLLSAIAYHESRFDNSVVSPRGATGLMQIMPVVARYFRYDTSQLSNPDINITIAAKLIKSINRELRLPPETSDLDRLAIMLAAYNSGIGTVQNARRQATAEGANCNSWEIVEQYLLQNGISQTSGYVRDVMHRYSSYRSAVNS